MAKRKQAKHIEVNPEVHARIKMQAFLAGMTIRDFADQLITAYEKTDANPLKPKKEERK